MIQQQSQMKDAMIRRVQELTAKMQRAPDWRDALELSKLTEQLRAANSIEAQKGAQANAAPVTQTLANNANQAVSEAGQHEMMKRQAEAMQAQMAGTGGIAGGLRSPEPQAMAKGGAVDSALSDYSQLLEAYPNAKKFLASLVANIERNVPTQAELENPEAMQQRAIGYMSPMAGGIEKIASPKNTVNAYKLFRTKANDPETLYPLFVNADEAIPLNEWVAAKAGKPAVGNPQKVQSSLGALAYRPGWHAGDIPVATHIGKGGNPPVYRPSEHQWAEVEFPNDVDWQSVANERGINNKGILIPKAAHITDQIPEGGFYRYKTSPNMTGNWLIGGEMKVNRPISDEEVRAINSASGLGIEDLPRFHEYLNRNMENQTELSRIINSTAGKNEYFQMLKNAKGNDVDDLMKMYGQYAGEKKLKSMDKRYDKYLKTGMAKGGAVAFNGEEKSYIDPADLLRDAHGDYTDLALLLQKQRELQAKYPTYVKPSQGTGGVTYSRTGPNEQRAAERLAMLQDSTINMPTKENVFTQYIMGEPAPLVSGYGQVTKNVPASAISEHDDIQRRLGLSGVLSRAASDIGEGASGVGNDIKDMLAGVSADRARREEFLGRRKANRERLIKEGLNTIGWYGTENNPDNMAAVKGVDTPPNVAAQPQPAVRGIAPLAPGMAETLGILNQGAPKDTRSMAERTQLRQAPAAQQGQGQGRAPYTPAVAPQGQLSAPAQAAAQTLATEAVQTSRSAADYINDIKNSVGENTAAKDLKTYLEEQGKEYSEAKGKAPWMALLQAGLATMAGTSPFALANIGAGAQTGFKSYADDMKDLRKEQDKARELQIKLAQDQRAEDLSLAQYGYESKRFEDAEQRKERTEKLKLDQDLKIAQMHNDILLAELAITAKNSANSLELDKQKLEYSEPYMRAEYAKLFTQAQNEKDPAKKALLEQKLKGMAQAHIVLNQYTGLDGQKLNNKTAEAMRDDYQNYLKANGLTIQDYPLEKYLNDIRVPQNIIDTVIGSSNSSSPKNVIRYDAKGNRI